MTRPSAIQLIPVFIGSSTETRDVAEAVSSVLGTSFQCVPWWDAFPPSALTLPVLVTAAKRRYRFSVFIGSADDVLNRRGAVDDVVRDNVLVEFLLFVGANGLEHTYLFLDTCKQPTLPSDFDGLVCATYDADEFRRDPSSAIRRGCDQITRRIFEVHALDAQRERKIEQVAVAEEITSQLSELAEAAFVLRDIVDTVQQETLEALLDEAKFIAVKTAAVGKIDEAWAFNEEKARIAGVLGEFSNLRRAILTMIAALPFPKEVFGGFDDARAAYENSVLASIPSLVEAVQCQNWTAALNLALGLRGKISPDTLTEEVAHIADSRLKRLKSNYADWWRDNSATLRKHLTNFQTALMRAQRRVTYQVLRNVEIAQ